MVFISSFESEFLCWFMRNQILLTSLLINRHFCRANVSVFDVVRNNCCIIVVEDFSFSFQWFPKHELHAGRINSIKLVYFYFELGDSRVAINWYHLVIAALREYACMHCSRFFHFNDGLQNDVEFLVDFVLQKIQWFTCLNNRTSFLPISYRPTRLWSLIPR